MSNRFGTQEEAVRPPGTQQRTDREIDDLDTNSIRKPSKEIARIVPGDTSFIMDNIKNCADEFNWDNVSYDRRQVHFITVKRNTDEYKSIEKLFKNTNRKCFQVTNIERIQNPYLLAAFLLKREQMSKRTENAKMEKLFHGTTAACVESICNDNFDWRRNGENRGKKFGQGISFTPKSRYATHYADDVMDGRIMILAYVLVGDEVMGTSDMVLPPQGADTSVDSIDSTKRSVIVKYEDNEFYPAYKITYKCTSKYERHRRMVEIKKYKQRQHKRANPQRSSELCSDNSD